jgi:peptide/nickel transport system substrate-binding protein
MYAGLTALDKDANLIPWVASKWQTSADGLALDVTIRQGVLFQDGSPLTAADVVFSAQQWTNQPALSFPSLRFSKVEQVSSDVVRFTFPRPVAAFISEAVLTEQNGGMGVIPKTYFEKLGSLDAFAKAPIGAGPYRLASRTPADNLVLEAHDKFFNGSPAVKTILAKIAPEDSTRVAMFRTGEADIAESIAPQHLSDLEKLPGAKVLSVRSGQEVVIHMNLRADKIPGTDQPNPFLDLRVRQAIQHAVDKKTLVERLVGRAGVGVKGPYSTFHYGADPDNITDYEYNPEKAKALLKEAKFPMDYSFPVYEIGRAHV